MRVVGIVALALLPLAQGYAQRPDFTGHWRLDTAASVVSGGGRGDASGQASGGGGGGGGGIGLGPPATELTVRQDDGTLTLGAVSGGDTMPIRYRFDGKRSANNLIVGRGAIAELNYTSKWKSERLVTTMVRTIAGRGRTTTVRYEELMYLTPDGALAIETSMVGRPGRRTAVYRRVSSPGG